MLLKYFYDSSLAHASYLIGCQKSGEAIVVDPGRDIEQYLATAAREKMTIVGVAETHIHADYVSGARELADCVGAKLYVSDEGPAEWKYEYAQQYPHHLLKDGDVFNVGKIEFKTLHTPGHTPESISFVLTDRGAGADQPMGIFTGDFVFVGSIGRPDLLELAAGIAGTAEPGARQLFHSIRRFRELPDHLQVWPAHGAGSACGKGLGAIPSSTVGYEKLFNPALQFEDEQEFVDYILCEQPEAPRYFALMKKVNKVGPEILGKASLPPQQAPSQLRSVAARHTVVDTASPQAFAAAHVPKTIHISMGMLANWGGTLLDYSQPLYLIASKKDLSEALRILHKIGCDNIAGYFDAEEVQAANLRTESVEQMTAAELELALKKDEVELVDVRGLAERTEMRIRQSRHEFLGKFLDQNFDLEVPHNKRLVFHCKGGGRSMIASSIAMKRGMKNVINLIGGIDAWSKEGLPTQSEPLLANSCSR
jgi:hydroxyacylglutathione hydrolase